MLRGWLVLLSSLGFGCAVEASDGFGWGGPFPTVSDDDQDPPSATGELPGGTTTGGLELSSSDDVGDASSGVPGDGSSGGPPACDADLGTDPEHCGACGHSCLGAACTAGVCQSVTLAAGLDFPNHLAVEGNRVLVGTNDGVFTVPKAGGGASLIHIGSVRHVVPDDERIFWVDNVAHDIPSVAIGDNQPTIHVSGITDPWALVADDDFLYWVDGGINKIPKSGGPIQVLVAEGGDPFYPWQLGIGGGRVYYRTEGGDLRSVSTGGGGDILLDHSDATYYNAGYHDGAVYAFRGDVGESTTLVRMSPDGTGDIEELISGQVFTQPMAFDDKNVYWRTFDSDTSRIFRMPLDGGPATILATFDGFSLGLDVDDQWVYWCQTDDGVVAKVAK